MYWDDQIENKSGNVDIGPDFLTFCVEILQQSAVGAPQGLQAELPYTRAPGGIPLQKRTQNVSFGAKMSVFLPFCTPAVLDDFLWPIGKSFKILRFLKVFGRLATLEKPMDLQ